MSGNGKHKRALYILENSKPIKLLMFQKMELSSPSSKKQKNLPPQKKTKNKNSYVSGSGTLLPHKNFFKELITFF